MGVLTASAVALATAPVLMPTDYSWLAHTTSESAAQGVSGAWLARLGLGLFGLAVLGFAIATASWHLPARVLHGAFGVFLVATAVFASRSWRPEAAYDRTEDLLHSGAATAMGFAFAGGVVAVVVGAPRVRARRLALGVVALVASVVLPLGMAAWPDGRGLLQRAMFGVAYAWYGTEVLRRSPPDGDP